MTYSPVAARLIRAISFVSSMSWPQYADAPARIAAKSSSSDSQRGDDDDGDRRKAAAKLGGGCRPDRIGQGGADQDDVRKVLVGGR